MNCPLCVDQVLDERFSHGIEVDVCPNCKGVWLDRGELERLAAQGRAADPTLLASSGHAAPQDGGSTPPPPVAPAPTEKKKSKKKDDRDRDWDDDDRERDRDRKKSKKKKSKKKRFSDLLEDVLDDVLDL